MMRNPLALCGRVTLRGWVALAILFAFTPPAVATTCADGIPPRFAQALFDRLKNVRVDDGYRFDGVDTKGEVIVRWSLHGKSCPPITLACAPTAAAPTPPALQARVPPALFSDCPGLRVVVGEVAKAIAEESPKPLELPRSVVALLAIAVTAAAGLALRALVMRVARRRAPNRQRVPRFVSVPLGCVAIIAAAEVGYRTLIWTSQRGNETGHTFALYGVGESTMAGEPFDEQMSLPMLVSEMLGRQVRGRPIEIHSVAARGLGASAQSLRFEREVAYRDRSVPGAVLIYSGHNEPYLGDGDGTEPPQERRALPRLLDRARRFSTGLWLLRDTLLDLRSLRLFRPRAGMQPYEQSLRRIIETAQDAGLAPMLFTLPSNISGVEPNAYAADAPGIAALLEKGTALEHAGDMLAALQYYRDQHRAIRSDNPSSALLLLYRIAHCEAALGLHAEARRDFWAVLNQDSRRNFGRATLSQNALLRALAAEYAIPLVDAATLFERESANGILGDDLFWDGHHPNLRAYALLAAATVHHLADAGYADPACDSLSADDIAARFGIGAAALARAHISAGSWLVSTSAYHPWPMDRLALAEQHFRAAVSGGDEFSAWFGIALAQAGRTGGFLRSGENLDLLGRADAFYTKRFTPPLNERASLLAQFRGAGVDDPVIERLEALWP